MSQLRSLLANRGFQAVWSASVVSGLGDKIAIIALYLLVYRLSGRAVDLGLLAAVQILPAVVLGPVSGLILDRYNRKAVMVVSDLASALLVAALPFAGGLTQVYLLAGLLSVGRQFTGPARLAIVADLVPGAQLDKANALSMVTKNVVMLVGPAVGGAVVALRGTDVAFWLDAATFLASAGRADARHFIAGVGCTPTILESLGLEPIPGLDGRSFEPLLRGKRQPNRDHVFTLLNFQVNQRTHPMRCVQNRRFVYIWNAWADGTTKYKTAYLKGPAYEALMEAAETDPAIAARMGLFFYRAPEELYDLEYDPNALCNLIDSPEHQAPLDDLRRRLLAEMARSGDPMRDLFVQRM